MCIHMCIYIYICIYISLCDPYALTCKPLTLNSHGFGTVYRVHSYRFPNTQGALLGGSGGLRITRVTIRVIGAIDLVTKSP